MIVNEWPLLANDLSARAANTLRHVEELLSVRQVELESTRESARQAPLKRAERLTI